MIILIIFVINKEFYENILLFIIMQLSTNHLITIQLTTKVANISINYIKE